MPVRIPDRILRLGHLSNLSLEKGLDRFLSCGFGPDGTARTDRRLVLAGAPSTPEATEALEKAALVLGDTLETHGAVSGERKAAFFRDIDLFVFPSLYRHEAQPLVALEALAYGKPVIALGFGYLAGLVGSTGG
ncbi:MAG: glycosyltransferase, partial [Novosphingobium sp.]